MISSNLKEKIRSGEVTIGTWLTIGHTSVVEILCDAGFDWITIDIEHNLINPDSIRSLIIAAHSKNTPVLVRVPKNDEVYIKHALDCGCDGLIIPMINSKSDADKITSFSFYPPLGSRGVGLSRAQAYGENFDSYVSNLQKKLVLIAQIENYKAIDNLEEIAKVEHIDSLMIGPYDLSASLGFPGQYDLEIVKNIISDFKFKCKKSNSIMGKHIVPIENERVINSIKEGFTFIAFGTDFQFLREAKKSVSFLKEKIK